MTTHYIGRLIATAFVLMLAGQGCKKPPLAPSDEVTIRRQDHMATYVAVSVAAPESPKVLEAIGAAFAEIDRLEALLSEWEPKSEISRVNNNAGIKAIPVGKELYSVIESAMGVSEASHGAFDITFQALHGLWDFHSLSPKIPDPAAVKARVKLVDYRQVHLNATDHSVMLANEGMKMGLGGIAKGYAVDAASRILQERGFHNHLVVAGGDLYASGRKKSRLWKIGVRSPKHPGMYATLEVQDEGVATSGNYERFFIKDGVRYHHILDPKTGMPARGLASVTVDAKNAMLADAYATAIFVLGKKQGLELARSDSSVETLVFDDQSYAATATKQLDARLEVLPEPDPKSLGVHPFHSPGSNAGKLPAP